MDELTRYDLISRGGRVEAPQVRDVQEAWTEEAREKSIETRRANAKMATDTGGQFGGSMPDETGNDYEARTKAAADSVSQREQEESGRDPKTLPKFAKGMSWAAANSRGALAASDVADASGTAKDHRSAAKAHEAAAIAQAEGGWPEGADFHKKEQQKHEELDNVPPSALVGQAGGWGSSTPATPVQSEYKPPKGPPSKAAFPKSNAAWEASKTAKTFEDHARAADLHYEAAMASDDTARKIHMEQALVHQNMPASLEDKPKKQK